MNIVIAPDSFKGTLTQVEAAKIMKQTILQQLPEANIQMKPMADGGEGTLDALLTAIPDSQSLSLTLTGPLGKQITTQIGIINNHTAIIEVATIIGLPLITENLRDPYKTTTYGIGEAIICALDQGIRDFIIGLGGSSTNDGGLGMLLALGATIKDESSKSIGMFGEDLFNIQSIDLSTLDSRIKDCRFVIASDVNHKLLGKNGATYVFGPQKGLEKEQLEKMDQAMARFAIMVEQSANMTSSLIHHKGAGSAGGLGFACLVLGAEFASGAKLIATSIHLEQSIKQADLVFTGEGKSDQQTVLGKAPGYVAELAQKYDVPVILVSGTIDDQHVLDEYFSASYSLVDKTVSLKQALNKPHALLSQKIKQIIQTYCMD